MENISFGQAWNHVASTGGYWLGLISITLVCGIVAWFVLIKPAKNGSAWSGGKTALVALLAALFLAALLYPPAECAANTTIEQASRGVYIR